MLDGRNVKGQFTLKYSPEELRNAVDEYFQMCDDSTITIYNEKGTVQKPKPYTLTGLCVHLGINRSTWARYKDMPEFIEITENALMRVENYMDELAMVGGTNPIWSIFSAKNNFGWTDRIDLAVPTKPEQLSVGDIREKLEERKRLMSADSDE